MAYIKPGSVVGGYTWTGSRWVRTPERTSDKAKVAREVKNASVDNNTALSPNQKSAVKKSQMKKAKASFPGGAPRMTKGGSYAPKGLEGGMRPTAKPKPKDTKDTKATPKPNPKPVTASTSKTTSTTSTAKPKPTNLTSGGGRAKTPASKRPAVSQSNTEWVKKGDTVGGKVVQKGYLAQKGKPEKKVTARVKLVTDTSKGKAGQKVSYTKGRASKGKSK
jgi:hypothetical protein